MHRVFVPSSSSTIRLLRQAVVIAWRNNYVGGRSGRTHSITTDIAEFCGVSFVRSSAELLKLEDDFTHIEFHTILLLAGPRFSLWAERLDQSHLAVEKVSFRCICRIAPGRAASQISLSQDKQATPSISFNTFGRRTFASALYETGVKPWNLQSHKEFLSTKCMCDLYRHDDSVHDIPHDMYRGPGFPLILIVGTHGRRQVWRYNGVANEWPARGSYTYYQRENKYHA